MIQPTRTVARRLANSAQAWTYAHLIRLLQDAGILANAKQKVWKEAMSV